MARRWSRNWFWSPSSEQWVTTAGERRAERNTTRRLSRRNASRFSTSRCAPQRRMHRMRHKPPIAISDDAKRQAIASVRRYFIENLDAEIGDLKAALVLDYFLREVGPTIYNQAIADARAFFEERSADLGA